MTVASGRASIWSGHVQRSRGGIADLLVGGYSRGASRQEAKRKIKEIHGRGGRGHADSWSERSR